ncbi:MAG: DUF1800 domain-containing protein [Planctomycetes bacterium]|nr:DUF1800 domain-containing protein [Planctomycetota bacterium]
MTAEVPPVASSSPASEGAASSAFERMWSRRLLLGAGVGAGLALAGSRGASAQLPTSTQPAGSRRQLAPVEPGDLFVLVNRTSQGWSEPLWAEATARGYQGYLEWQLDHQAIGDAALDAVLTAFPSIFMTSKQIQDGYVVPGMTNVAVAELKKACVLRSILSQRQLFEHMVEFWTDHFNIDQSDGENQVLKTTDDRDVIRAHALGNFRDLLKASAHSGAMLYYLDNFSNRNTGVNENYAREIMELHTLAPGNYTETDVRELAKILTGWTIWRQADANYGTFRYRSEWHDNGAHTVLGHVYGPNGGQAEGEAALDQLLDHPACANFIATKLCKWLLSYAPPQSVIDDVALAYTRTNGDIKTMIRTVFKPDNVQLAAPHLQPKLKRPFAFVTSLMRATNASFTGTPTTGAQTLLNELVKFGHMPYAWGPPDGYPDREDYWGNAVLPRWNFASRLLDNLLNGISVDVTALFAGVSQAQCAERCNQLLLGGRMDPADVAEVHAFAMSFPSLTTQAKRESLALAASSPSYQHV